MPKATQTPVLKQTFKAQNGKGPQLYDFEFGNKDQREAFGRLIGRTARELNIQIETRYEEAKLQLAVENGESYQRLIDATMARVPEDLQHLIEHETLKEAYLTSMLEELEKDPNAFKFPEQTCQCDGYEHSR